MRFGNWMLCGLVALTVSGSPVYFAKERRTEETHRTTRVRTVHHTGHHRTWHSTTRHNSSPPPGLAKRGRMTPGHENRLRKRGSLPPGIEKKTGD